MTRSEVRQYPQRKDAAARIRSRTKGGIARRLIRAERQAFMETFRQVLDDAAVTTSHDA